MGDRWEKTQALFSDGLCIETVGRAGKTRHVFTAGESMKASDESCLLNVQSWSRCVM